MKPKTYLTEYWRNVDGEPLLWAGPNIVAKNMFQAVRATQNHSEGMFIVGQLQSPSDPTVIEEANKGGDPIAQTTNVGSGERHGLGSDPNGE